MFSMAAEQSTKEELTSSLPETIITVGAL